MPWPDGAASVTAGELRAQPGDGRPVAGAVLPSEARLAANYLVSRQSARTALRQPAAGGLVIRVPGRGTLVAPPAREATRAREEIG